MTLLALLFAGLLALWAWAAVGAMLDVRRRGLASRRGWQDGPASEWRGLSGWWRDPAETPRRRRLAVLTLALVALVLLSEGLEA